MSDAALIATDGKVKARRGRPPKNRKTVPEAAPDVQVADVRQQVETTSAPAPSFAEPHEISNSTVKVPTGAPSVANARRGFPPLEARSDARDRRPRAMISEAAGSAESSNGSRMNRFNNTGFNNTNSRSLRPVPNRSRSQSFRFRAVIGGFATLPLVARATVAVARDRGYAFVGVVCVRSFGCIVAAVPAERVV